MVKIMHLYVYVVFCRGIRVFLILGFLKSCQSEQTLPCQLFSILFVFQFNHKKLKPKMVTSDSDSYSYCSYTVLENLELARPLA